MVGKLNGLLLIDKPQGWTSFDVVKYIRNIAAKVEGKKSRNVKVGHTGTLDPAATGLLLVCVGNYTKKVPLLIKQDKSYEVTLTLGYTSTTGDSEGELTELTHERPSESAVLKAVKSFTGTQMQTPPAFSAIKVNGKRAYELARAGEHVELKAREVTVYSITEIKYDYPQIKFIAEVSSGTYIRTLASDIGETLKTGAYMSALRRSTIGDYELSDAVNPKTIDSKTIEKHLWKTD